VSDVWAFIAAHWLGILLALLGLAALAWAARPIRRPVHPPQCKPAPRPFISDYDRRTTEIEEPPPEPPRAA
jgi:hypothetical protein